MKTQSLKAGIPYQSLTLINIVLLLQMPENNFLFSLRVFLGIINQKN